MNNATNMKRLDDFKKASKYINKKHNIKSNEKVFLFVGRLNLLKNILFIVDCSRVNSDAKLDRTVYIGRIKNTV